MKKPIATILLLVFILARLSAQGTKDSIATYKPLLFEKLYLHVDRELYAPGDKIWLKAYQVNGFSHKLNSNFRNIYVQLIAEDGRVAKGIMLFSIKGQANGSFNTDSLESGMYTIRAYTRYLENFGDEAYFHKKILITDAKRMAEPEQEPLTDSKIDVSFLPEGGSMVLNAPNTVAFKAIDPKGRGIYVSGNIMNDRGDTVTSFAATYLGMGKLIIMPKEGENYQATIDQFPGLKFQLPKAIGNAISLRFKEKGEMLLFEVSSNMKLDKYPEFSFVASHKGLVLLHRKIRMIDFTHAITVGKDIFPTGISKITLLDSALIPLAERLIFIDKDPDDLLALKLNQKEFMPREEVKLDVDALLEPGDSINSCFSVAVVNRNYLSTGECSQNIKSYLLLDSDLKGAIESPAAYFVDDKLHTSVEKLDLLMLVHGWRTYLWDEIGQTPTPSIDDWNDAGINISGHVRKLLWNAPVPEAEVSMDYMFRNFCIGKTITDQTGRFRFENTFLIDSSKVMINAQKKKGSPNVEIVLDPIPKPDSLVASGWLNNSCLDISLSMNFNRENSFRQMKEKIFNPEKGTILLEGVDIVEKKNTPFTHTVGDYAWADKTLTVTKEDYDEQNVLWYLVAKGGLIYFSGDIISMASSGLPPEFLLDGSPPNDFNQILFLPMSSIDRVDIIRPHSFYKSKMTEVGVIAIYRKPMGQIDNREVYVKGRVMLNIKGFYKEQKFYSPKYSLENINNPKPDYRPTLYWNPNVSFVNGKANLGFFTSDELTDYLVLVEGISKRGKIFFGITNFTVSKE